MGKVVISFRIDEKLKGKMERLKHINWSDVVRKAIQETIEKEEEKLRRKKKNAQRIKEALVRNIALERRVEGWSSVEEIRRWRERRA